MAGQLQTNIASTYVSQMNTALSVPVLNKLSQWKFLQQLGFGANLTHLQQNFHGIQDFFKQLTNYSNTNWILRAAWQVIKMIAPKNQEILKLMTNDPVMGQVGQVITNLHGFGDAFAKAPDILKTSPASIAKSILG